jgi:ribosomal protein L19
MDTITKIERQNQRSEIEDFAPGDLVRVYAKVVATKSVEDDKKDKKKDKKKKTSK